MEHNWFWLVKSRIWKGFRVKGHRSPPPHTIDFIECRDETTVSIVRSWPSNYRMCTRIPFINQSSIHANCLLTAKCVRSRSWLQETGQNRALAIWCRLGTGTTFKTQNWSIFLLDQAQKKKKQENQKRTKSIVPRPGWDAEAFGKWQLILYLSKASMRGQKPTSGLMAA